jgi:hypothetical protein
MIVIPSRVGANAPTRAEESPASAGPHGRDDAVRGFADAVLIVD